MNVFRRELIYAIPLLLAVTACGDLSEVGGLSVERDVVVNHDAARVWAVVGDFAGLHRWHPAVTATRSEEDGEVRILVLGDGAEIRERLLAYADGVSYRYKILAGPLPVADYVSTLKVSPLGAGATKVTWSSTFNAAGAADDEAVEVITSVYDAGLGNIAQTLR